MHCRVVADGIVNFFGMSRFGADASRRGRTTNGRQGFDRDTHGRRVPETAFAAENERGRAWIRDRINISGIVAGSAKTNKNQAFKIKI
jgi:hypothetical protein